MTDTQAQAWDIVAKCEKGHAQRMELRGFNQEMAQDFASMLDGTNPMFVHSPRTNPLPGSQLGRCQYPDCGAWFIYEVVPHNFAQDVDVQIDSSAAGTVIKWRMPREEGS